jgi:hypothetical protein
MQRDNLCNLQALTNIDNKQQLIVKDQIKALEKLYKK